MEDLKSFRKRINEIDDQLVELLENRLEVAEKIALYKIKNNLPIFDEKREVQVIERNIKKLKNEDFKDEIKEFTVKIMELSRRVQKRRFKAMSIKVE